MYAKCLKSWEFRTVMTLANLWSFLGGAFGLMFLGGWNEKIGLSDKMFYACYIFLIEALGMAFIDLPGMVLLAKITPK